jgi:monosaccharide-transporting ATPase
MNSTPIIVIEKIIKDFPGVKALDGVDFSLLKGEIHALMGENGAGKSTLIKVLTGVYHRDSGEILYEGHSIDLKSPFEAPLIGLSTVYQEINLVPTLSVAENIYLGRQPRKALRIDWRSVKDGATAALARLGIELDVSRQLSSFPIAIQQMVAIARAIDIKAKVLILDEPTSSLDSKETKRLFSVMRRLQAEGIGIIFVTHFLEQVYEISNRITILRNGALVGTFETATLSKGELVSKMMGKEFVASGARELASESVKSNKETIIEAEGLGKLGMIKPFDIKLRKGEVFGLAGLLGSGRTEIAELLFGIAKADKGACVVEGKNISIHNPRIAIGLGFGFCPEDRKSDGIIDELTVRENIILALQAHKGIFKTLNKARQSEIADRYVKSLGIATPSLSQKVKFLSGGNQQKVILARWLASNPRFLILDEPTRGIDIGAKIEIQKTILLLAEEGISILFISSELSEVVRCCSRVAVLKDREKIGELSGADITEPAIMASIAQG